MGEEMSDICACNDKRCPSRTLCYRYVCKKDTYQSYFAKSPRKPHAVSCDQFMSNNRKTLTMTEYNNMIAGIIKKGKPVSDTLIEMLEEAGKYDVKVAKKVAKVSQKVHRICDKSTLTTISKKVARKDGYVRKSR